MQWFLVVVQLDAQFLFNVFIYSSLHVSSMSCLSSGETDCINTASGKCHSVLVAVSCTGWEFTPNQHTTLPQTRNDNYQKLYWYNLFLLMMSMTCSKHVENYKWINTLKRICASSWTITKNHVGGLQHVCIILCPITVQWLEYSEWI